MRVTLIIGLMVSALMLVDPSQYTVHERSGGTVKGTVTLSEQPSVIRTGPRGRYGMGRGNRSINSEEPSVRQALIWLEGPAAFEQEKGAKKPVLNQIDKSFDPRLIAIRKGGTVRILNSDPVYHNVFSLSKTKKFDVGRRPKDEYMDVVFDKAGKVDVFCDIHSNMHAVIYVLPPRAVTWIIREVDKPFVFSDVAPGTYTLHVYATGFEKFREIVEVAGEDPVELGTITLSN